MQGKKDISDYSLEEFFRILDKHLVEDDKPSVFLEREDVKKFFREREPFKHLYALREIEQSTLYHPEGSVWNHTLLVVDEAAKRRDLSKNPRVFMWAALLHDLGKLKTTEVRKGKITAYDHDKIGAYMAEEFLQKLNCDEVFIREVVKLVRWHMQVLFVVKGLPFAEVERMMQEINENEVALLAICDRLGRGELTEEIKDKEENDVRKFLEVCRKIKSGEKPEVAKERRIK
ncbi:HDIG domain-containing metalloprotein [Thermosyntropha sp.]|uniref:HDIG domain-containing metalloprotein n=1 Tax=Thermosyntropha sp. TaxID=2740820 RepID=UPI0025DF631F|nr:HDIG domain-containing metalloprotein [Thermosyntropha sp.]MBO8159621.1 HDIG domain-containing protein [Thermosyntropha sp.]